LCGQLLIHKKRRFGQRFVDDVRQDGKDRRALNLQRLSNSLIDRRN
jgi:hypothetical protein